MGKSKSKKSSQPFTPPPPMDYTSVGPTTPGLSGHPLPLPAQMPPWVQPPSMVRPVAGMPFAPIMPPQAMGQPAVGTPPPMPFAPPSWAGFRR